MALAVAIIVILISGSLLIAAGHILRAFRWFILLNDLNVSSSLLVRATATGQVSDLVLPWRLGELVRAGTASRNTRTRFSHVLASIIIERCLDIACVGVIAACALIFKLSNDDSVVTLAMTYGYGVMAIVTVITLTYWQSQIVRRWMWGIATWFGVERRFSLLSFSFSLFDSVRTIILSRVRIPIVSISLLMWTCYVSAYVALTHAGLISMKSLVSLFQASSITSPRISQFQGAEAWAIFSPSFVLLVPLNRWELLAQAFARRFPSIGRQPIGRLPFATSNNEEEFLTRYFSDRDTNWCNAYRSIHSGVSIISNCSGLSSATTTIVRDEEGRLLYRKFQIGHEFEKLNAQFNRLRGMPQWLPTTPVFNPQLGSKYFSYDMPYEGRMKTFGEALHFVPRTFHYESISRILRDLDCFFDFHDKTFTLDQSLDRFVEEKLHNSFQSLASHPIGKYLLLPTPTVVNEESLLSVSQIAGSPIFKRAISLLSKESLGTIHGDLTLDNIVLDCDDPSNYLLIDPATEVILPSRTHDLAKLLQSTITRQSLTTRYDFTGDWTESVVLKVIDEPNLAAFSQEFVAKVVAHRPESDQITLRVRLMTHWLRLVVHRISSRDPNMDIYLTVLLVVWNNCFRDLESSSYVWRDNYCVI